MNEQEKIHQVYFESDIRGINEEYHVALREAMLADVGGVSALEIGVGAGDWTRILSNAYDRLDIVEASESLLERVQEACRGHRATITPHACELEDFEPPAESHWNHIFMTFLLEHLIDPVSQMKRISKWLAPGGKLFVAVPNANSLHRVLAVRMGLIRDVTELSENDHRVGHQRVYTTSELKRQLEEAGFRRLEFRHVGLKPLALSQMEGWGESLVKTITRSGDLAPEHAAYIGVVVQKEEASDSSGNNR